MSVIKAFLFAALLLIASPGKGAHADALCETPLNIRVSSDYLPFSFRDTSGEFRGIDVVLIQELFSEIDCEINLVAMPFKRAIIELAAGHIDMMPFASITKKRKAFAHFSSPYRYETAGLIVRTEDLQRLKINSLQDVIDNNLVLGHEQSAYRGGDFEAFLADPVSRPHIYNVVTTTEGIRMLETYRIDALVESPAAILAAAEEMGLGSRFAEHPFTLISDPVHFMFSRKSVSQELVDALDLALARKISSTAYQTSYGSMALPRADGPAMD
ncbi:substrate-binding periplasmic protein [Roseibium sp.]|uniref:substrate-binding periplasmic protein n=1 Tax=Roseibium sp. TaxID=1936156 RepID=UPI003B51AD1A